MNISSAGRLRFGEGSRQLLSKVLIKSPKTDISISPWKAGKIPAQEFTLRRGQKPISQGSSYKWRIVTFISAGCRCKIWINFNYNKLIYRATLAYEADGLYRIVCIREFHPSEPGWHCHAALTLDKGKSDLTHRDLLRHPKKVPVGRSITLPFSYFGETSMTLYVIEDKSNKSKVRLEDSGETISNLEMLGVDLGKQSRLDILNTFASECGVIYGREECVFHTPFFDSNELPNRIFSFSQFMIGVQRMTFLIRKNVEEVFKEEVISAIRQRFVGEAEVRTERTEIRKVFQDSPVDVIVKAGSNKPLAVFIGTSESRALEALLLYSELRDSKRDPANIMLIMNQTKSNNVSKKTINRAENRFSVSYFSENAPERSIQPMRDMVFEGTRALH